MGDAVAPLDRVEGEMTADAGGTRLPGDRPVSARRLAANRANARRSTGPRTAAGKARARANAVKHGLTGAGIALPGEDRVAIEARFVELQAELQPADLLGMIYVEQAALMSVRIRRAAEHEAAALATAACHAAAAFERERLDAVDRLYDDLAADPGPNRRRLLAAPEGIDRLAAALAGVRDQIRAGRVRGWGEAERAMVEALFGRRRAAFPPSPTASLLEILAGDAGPTGLQTLARPGGPPSRLEQARAELIRLVEAELATLEQARAALDPQALADDRAGAAALARFDAGPAATAARKYEAAARREFHRALRDLHAHEAALVEPEVEPEVQNEPIEPEPEPEVQNEPIEPEPKPEPEVQFAGPRMEHGWNTDQGDQIIPPIRA